MVAAALVPIMTSMGATAATAATVGTVASGALTGFSLLSGVASAQQQRNAYKMQAQGVKEQAYMEGLRAKDESIARRERLLNAMAGQNARAGASGVTGGSTSALQLDMVNEYRADKQKEDIMNQATQSGFSRQSSALNRQGVIARNQSLLTTGTKLMEIG